MARKATKFGERSKQLAGWDLGGQQEFPIGNVYNFLRSPEFQTRLDEMFRAGQPVMQGRPSWWSISEGPIADVYGRERIPYVAGFIASTSNKTEPRENLQLATEYIRRWLKGEPQRQPQFRVPEGSLRAPGQQMPLEAARIQNLERAAAGNVGEISADKMNDMVRALMGDPNAMVLDRQYAKPMMRLKARTQSFSMR